MILTDGSVDFSGGVDSSKATTIKSIQNPNGLDRNELAWANNASVRDGGVRPRGGWIRKGRIHDGSAWFGGACRYDALDNTSCVVVMVGGVLYQVSPDFTYDPVDLTGGDATLVHPQTNRGYFCQAEDFLVVQAGDGVTLPLFWDGTTLRRSVGIINNAVAPGTNGVNEIPAAYSMDYYMGRLWYAQRRVYGAGDIVRGPSGTAMFDFNDAVLQVTECPLVLYAAGGDSFAVPTLAGPITALRHSANIDAALGEGRLFIFCRGSVYSLTVPVDRTAWLATDINTQPVQTVIQNTSGASSDWSVVAVNSDLFYQSSEPQIRSVAVAMRSFGQWANVPISANVNRALRFNDRALLYAASGVRFANRLLQTALPQYSPQGVVHKAIIALDFQPISSFKTGTNPIWEGPHEGLDILQLVSGFFSGMERCFAVCRSTVDGGIDLWELTDDERFEENDRRVQWSFETPAYNFQNMFMLKKLVGGEVWLDRLYGTVDIIVEYRPDGEMCWIEWARWSECVPRSSCEDMANPVCYPLTPYGESYRATRSLPKPPDPCATAVGRPSNLAYQFQVRITVNGFCRIRGIILHAERVVRRLYTSPVC